MSLKKILLKIKNFAIYGGIEKEEYHSIILDILRKNRGSLRMSSGMCAVMFLGLFIGACFSDALAQAWIFYAVMTLGCSIIYILTFFEKTNRCKIIWGLWYLLYFMLGSYAVTLNTFIRPELSAVTLCVFLMAAPLMIVDRPIRIVGLQLLICIEYLIFSQYTKDAYLAFADSVNIICCVFLGFGVYLHLNRLNLQETLQAQHLRHERDTDKLTGLLNKAAIEERIETRLAQSRDYGALVLIDLDDFKHINDSYGHLYGDTVLRRVAECIRDIMPESSICGRFGGDEFLILLPGIMEDELKELLNAIMIHAEENIKLPLPEDSFGMSIGAVFYPHSGKEYDGLLQLADNAMYEVKKADKNGWKIV